MYTILCNGLLWVQRDPRATSDHLGFIPEFLSVHDRRPAREQFDENYASGGGWVSFKGLYVLSGGRYLKYPGDPPMHLLWEVRVGEETVRVYELAWVTITQADGSVDCARID